MDEKGTIFIRFVADPKVSLRMTIFEMPLNETEWFERKKGHASATRVAPSGQQYAALDRNGPRSRIARRASKGQEVTGSSGGTELSGVRRT